MTDIDVMWPDANRLDAKPDAWACVSPEGEIVYFDDEDKACAYQREWRHSHDLDPETGEPQARLDRMYPDDDKDDRSFAAR